MSLTEYTPGNSNIISTPVVPIYGQNLFNKNIYNQNVLWQNNFPLNIPRLGHRTVKILASSVFFASVAVIANYLYQKGFSKIPIENRLCESNFTEEKVVFNKYCTIEQKAPIRDQWVAWKTDKINEKYLEQKRANEERDRISKEEARIELEEWRNEFQAKIDKDKEGHRIYKEEVKEKERRRTNPTPEEKREDDIEILSEILKEKPYMEIPLRLSHPWFFVGKKMCDRECKEEARKVLGVNSDANCQEIRKKFQKLSLDGAHPDKNSDNSNDDFIKISDAYEGLCQYKK